MKIIQQTHHKMVTEDKLLEISNHGPYSLFGKEIPQSQTDYQMCVLLSRLLSSEVSIVPIPVMFGGSRGMKLGCLLHTWLHSAITSLSAPLLLFYRCPPCFLMPLPFSTFFFFFLKCPVLTWFLCCFFAFFISHFPLTCPLFFNASLFWHV